MVFPFQKTVYEWNHRHKMLTPVKRKKPFAMHWSAWLSIILAILGLWLLLEIAALKNTLSVIEKRYVVAQHDISAKSPPSKGSLAETAPAPPKMITTDDHPRMTDRSLLSSEDEVSAIADKPSPPDPDRQPLAPLVPEKILEAKTTLAVTDSRPPSEESPTDSLASQEVPEADATMAATDPAPPSEESPTDALASQEAPEAEPALAATDPAPPSEESPTDSLASQEAPEAETTVAATDPAPPSKESPADAAKVPSDLSDNDTITEPLHDPLARYVVVWTGNIRRKPNNQSASLFQLRWGQKVTVLDDQGRWYHIETTDGQRGWGHKILFDNNPPSFEAIPGLKGVVETIRVQMDGARACTVFMDLDSNHPPKTEVLEGEAPRLVSDYPRMMASPDIGHTISVHNGVINAIRVGITSLDDLTTRVVVDLIPGVDYVVDQVFYEKEQTYALHIKVKEV